MGQPSIFSMETDPELGTIDFGADMPTNAVPASGDARVTSNTVQDSVHFIQSYDGSLSRGSAIEALIQLAHGLKREGFQEASQIVWALAIVDEGGSNPKARSYAISLGREAEKTCSVYSPAQMTVLVENLHKLAWGSEEQGLVERIKTNFHEHVRTRTSPLTLTEQSPRSKSHEVEPAFAEERVSLELALEPEHEVTVVSSLCSCLRKLFCCEWRNTRPHSP